jgi:Zn-dependent protease with chaperone function
MATVLAHEVAHLKNQDTEIRVLTSTYRRFLFFDPIIRTVDSSLRREKEILADELSAKLTKKPLSLISALLKISSAKVDSATSVSTAVTFLRRERNQELALLRRRIQKLQRIADDLDLENASPSH